MNLIKILAYAMFNFFRKHINKAIDYIEKITFQGFLMSLSILGLNVALMLFISFYWLDPGFHTFLTGKPF